MATWILSIVGIVSIGVLLDIIIPEGEINKYIKGIFSIVTICVIIAPLPKLVDKNFDIADYLGGVESVTIDDNFVSEINEERVANLEESVKKMLENNGAENVIVVIYVKSHNTLDIDSVSVTVDTGSTTNSETLKTLVANKLGIQKTEVRIVVRE